MMGCPCISVYMKAVCEYTPRVHSRKILSLYPTFRCRSLTTKPARSTPTRANARNVSFRISLRWPIHIINSVDKTNLQNNNWCLLSFQH